MAGLVDGYEAEEHEVDAIVAGLVGDRDPGEPDESWFAHLSDRLAVLAAATERVSQQRDDLVVAMLAGTTERGVAQRLGLSPTRPGQLARRARERAKTTTGGGQCSG